MGWGAIGSAIGSSIGDMVGQKVALDQSHKRTKRLAQWQRNWEVENYQNAHQWEAEDLRKAGMNPALTATNGTNIGGSNAGSLTSPMPLSNLGKTMTEAANAWAKFDALEPQKEALRGQANEANANAAKTVEETNIVKPESKQRIKESNSRIAVNASQQREMEQNVALAGQQTVGQQLGNQMNMIELAYKKGDWAKTKRYVDDAIETVGKGGNAFLSWITPFSVLRGAKNLKEFGEAFKNFQNTTVGKMIMDYGKSQAKRRSSRR